MTSEQLKKWRKDNSYSQIDLAQELGVTNVCISRWEIGMRKIPPFLALALRALELEGAEFKKRVRKRKKGERSII